MAVPSSGPLKLWNDIWNSEIGGTKGNNSLHSASVYAGFSTPDAMSDFYGWSDVEVPTVTTSAMSSVTYYSMASNGNLSATGGENPDRGFYFGTSSTRTSNAKYSVGVGGTGNFSRSYSGLTYSRTYYAWAYACNSAGEAVGAGVSAATSVPPFSPSPANIGDYYARWGSNTPQQPSATKTYQTGYINPYTGGAVALDSGNDYDSLNVMRTNGRFATNAQSYVGAHINRGAAGFNYHCACGIQVGPNGLWTANNLTFTNNGPYRDQSCTFPGHTNGGDQISLQAISFINGPANQDLLRWTPGYTG